MDGYLSTRDVAQRYGVTVQTVRLWIKAGKLKHIKLTPRLYRIKESDLEAFERGETQSAEAGSNI
jgi:excisionase family DNA binding protein